VLHPAILARVKETDEFSCGPMDGCYIASLIPIAKITGKSQILRIARAAMFTTDNMIDLVRETGIILV